MTRIYVSTTAGPGTRREFVSLSDREKIMAVLANPSAHGPEVHKAITVLTYAGRSTSDTAWMRGSETAEMEVQFQDLVDFYWDATRDEVDDPFDQPDVPQFVPADWAQTLEVRIVEDTDFRLPWLDDL